jgi:3-hydroxy acid dehydrogenase/malonic semialdehyde reductase
MNKSTSIAMITGASSGIGAAIAHVLAKASFNLIITGRRLERLQYLAAELSEKYQIQVHICAMDVRERDVVTDCINQLPEGWRNIRVLVNNAGLAWGLEPIDEGDPDKWDAMMDTNVKGLLYVSKAVIPLMPKDGSAHIINIGSIAGKEVYANGAVYCASKFAVDALSKGMRIDLAKYPIRVGCVHPGAVETEFSLIRFDGDATRASKVYEGFENLVAEDVAEAVWFMLNRPPHININELTIMPTAQPAAGIVHKRNV